MSREDFYEVARMFAMLFGLLAIVALCNDGCRVDCNGNVYRLRLGEGEAK